MDKTKEQSIERFVRFPESMSKSEYESVKELIAQSKEAKQIAEWFQAFYAEFEKLERPVEFKLTVFKSKASYSGPLVLAADSAALNTAKLVTKATYSSEEEGTLVRVLEDTEAKAYQFHVLSKYLSEEDRVVINFEKLGVDFVTDKGGRLKKIKMEELSVVNWNELSIVLRLPTSTCSYDPGSEASRFILCDECSMHLDQSTCVFSTSENKVHRILLEQEQHVELIYLEGGTVSFQIDSDKPFKVYLYT